MPLTSVFSVALFVVVSFSVTASADLYKYRDGNGTLCMTDSLDNVPARYRSRVTVIRDGSPAAPAPVAVADPVSAKPAEKAASPPQETAPQVPQDHSLLKKITLSIAAIAAALFVGRLARGHLPVVVGRVVRISLYVALVVFLFKTYAERLSVIFASVKHEAGAAQRAVDKSAERIKKQAD